VLPWWGFDGGREKNRSLPIGHGISAKIKGNPATVAGLRSLRGSHGPAQGRVFWSTGTVVAAYKHSDINPNSIVEKLRAQKHRIDVVFDARS